MKNLTIVFMAAAAFASVGCKKKGGVGEAMAKMGEFKDEMCKCTDKKCADAVQDKMNKWSADNAKNAGDKPEKPSDEDMKKMQDVGTKYGECMAKAMGGGGDTTTPPPAGSAAAGSGSAAPAADAPKVGEGPVIPARSLAMLDLPPVKGIEGGSWSAVEPEKDGDRRAYYKAGDKGIMGVDFIDCNAPKLKEFVSKAPEDRGVFDACFQTATGKLGDYPMVATADNWRTIRVGHLTITATIAETAKDKLKAADVEAWLQSLDLAAISKL